MEELKLKGPHKRRHFLRLYKKCRDVRLRERYHAMYLSFTYSWREISEILGRKYETVLEWAQAYNEHGIEGLKMDKPSGRPSSLTHEQLSALKETVKVSPRKQGFDFSNWSCKRIRAFIVERFVVKLSVERIRQLMHKLGFVLIKPSYKYVLADRNERNAFKRRIKRVFSALGTNDVLLFQDEASVKQHPTIIAKWALKGTKEFVGTLGNHAKVAVFGAISTRGNFYHVKSKNINGKEFMRFVRHLFSVYKDKRIFLVIDNAPWHKSGEVQKFLLSCKERLTVVLLPAYSPDFNPIEHLWKYMREVVSHNTFFLSIKDIWNALSEFFRNLQNSPKQILSRCSTDYLFG